MDPKKAKSQIADQLKNAGSVLVTTNSSPSTDELSATIGLTHLLLAMKKHATAVVSSDIPSSLKFLGTDENVETSTDRMRDFVLSFDKEKADKFRYKLVDDQVKIFITPYKTIITKDDFNFTQGDFNIDAIVVIGATNREALDGAILKHGRILHEAEVLTINAGKNQKPSIGSVNWIDEEASSVSEMLVSISEALGSDLLNKDSAQSFLTGIIDSTEMFSSTATSPKVMTMAAQLMAAGANQHKIIEELKVPEPEPPVSMPADKPDETETDDDEAQPEEQQPEPPKKEDGVSVDLSKMHEKETQATEQSQPQPATPVAAEPAPAQKVEPTPSPPAPELAASPPPPPPPKAPAAETKPQDEQSSHGGYLKGSGPSGAGGTSVNSTNQSSDNSQMFSHPQVAQAPQPADDEPHINVHPELPTMKAQHKTITPPPPPKPIQTPEEKVQQVQSQPVQPQQQPAAPSKPQQPQPQQPAPAQNSDSTDGADDINSARKAVEQAIASSPPSVPTPRQDTSAKPPEQGGDIIIDHQGNIQNQNQSPDQA